MEPSAARECLQSTPQSATTGVGKAATRGTVDFSDSSTLAPSRRSDSSQLCNADAAATLTPQNNGGGFAAGKKAHSQQDLTVEKVTFYINEEPNQLLKHSLRNRVRKHQHCAQSNSVTDVRRSGDDNETERRRNADDSVNVSSSSRLNCSSFNVVVDDVSSTSSPSSSAPLVVEPDDSNLIRRLTRSDTRSSFRMKQAKKERLETWGSDFDKLLKDPAGVYAFSEFLRKQYSQENINFWVACENFKVCDDSQRTKVAMDVYDKYFATGCSEPVNVDSMVKQTLRDNVASQSFTPAMYNQAQYQIFHLMKYDCYPRFLKSDDYHRCWEVVEKGQCLPEMKEPFLKGSESCSSWFSSLGKANANKEKENKDEKKKKLQLPWKPKFVTSKKLKDDATSPNPAGPDEPSSKLTNDASQKRKQGWRSGKQHSTPNEVMNSVRPKSQLALVARTNNDIPSTSSSCPPDVVPQPDPPSTPSPGLSRNCIESDASTSQTCTVILPNKDKIALHVRTDQTVKQWLNDLGRRYGFAADGVDVVDVETEDNVNLMLICTRALDGRTVRIDSRVLFKLDIPNLEDPSQRKIVLVKARSDSTSSQVLRPIFNKYGLLLDSMVVTVVGSNEVLPNHSSIAQANNKRLMVLTQDEFQEWVHRDHDGGSPTSCSSTQFNTSPGVDEMVDQKTLEQLPSHKGLSVLELPQDSESKKTFSLPKAGGMLKFVKKTADTKLGGEKKVSPTKSTKSLPSKTQSFRNVTLTPEEMVERSREEKKLAELLNRAQSTSFEDQRGSSIKNVELPDFLREKGKRSKDDSGVVIPSSSSLRLSRPTEMVHRRLCSALSNGADVERELSISSCSSITSPRERVSLTCYSSDFDNFKRNYAKCKNSPAKLSKRSSNAATPVIRFADEAGGTDLQRPAATIRGGVKSLGSTPNNPSVLFCDGMSASESPSSTQSTSTNGDNTLKSGDLKQFVERQRGICFQGDEWQVDYI